MTTSQERKEKEKVTHVDMYRHECEHVGPMLITAVHVVT